MWHNGDCYRLEFLFEDILESHGYCLGEDARLNALLLKVLSIIVMDKYLFSISIGVLPK